MFDWYNIYYYDSTVDQHDTDFPSESYIEDGHHILNYFHSDHLTPMLLVVFKVANVYRVNRSEDWC